MGNLATTAAPAEPTNEFVIELALLQFAQPFTSVDDFDKHATQLREAVAKYDPLAFQALTVARTSYDFLHAIEHVTLVDAGDEKTEEYEKRGAGGEQEEETEDEPLGELPQATAARRVAPAVKIYRVTDISALVPFRKMQRADVLARYQYASEVMNQITTSDTAVRLARRRFKRSLPILVSSTQRDLTKRIIAFLQYIQYDTTVNTICTALVQNSLNWAASYVLRSIDNSSKKLRDLLTRNRRLHKFLFVAHDFFYPEYLKHRRRALQGASRAEPEPEPHSITTLVPRTPATSRVVTVNLNEPRIMAVEDNLMRPMFAVNMCIMHSQYPMQLREEKSELLLTTTTFTIPPNFTLVRFPMALFTFNATTPQDYLYKVTDTVSNYVQVMRDATGITYATSPSAEDKPKLLIHMLEKLVAKLKQDALKSIQTVVTSLEQEVQRQKAKLQEIEDLLTKPMTWSGPGRDEYYKNITQSMVEKGLNPEQIQKMLEQYYEQEKKDLQKGGSLHTLLVQTYEELLDNISAALQQNIQKLATEKQHVNMFTKKPVVNIFLPGEVVPNKLYTTNYFTFTKSKLTTNLQNLYQITAHTFQQGLFDCSGNKEACKWAPKPDQVVHAPAVHYRGRYSDTYCVETNTPPGTFIAKGSTSLERVVKYYADNGFRVLYMIDFSCSGMDDVQLHAETAAQFASLFTETGMAGGS